MSKDDYIDMRGLEEPEIAEKRANKTITLLLLLQEYAAYVRTQYNLKEVKVLKKYPYQQLGIGPRCRRKMVNYKTYLRFLDRRGLPKRYELKTLLHLSREQLIKLRGSHG